MLTIKYRDCLDRYANLPYPEIRGFASRFYCMKERIGVIDLGTNTFHLLVAEVNNGTMSLVHRERQAVKIGMGGINQGVIKEDAIERALRCLQGFKATLDREHVGKVQALGTSALRSATNGGAVIHAIKEETGIEVQLITGEEEAEYIYYGVQAAMDLGTSPSLIVDIGGGSVEFIVADRARIFWKASLDIGAQRMLERYHRHDPILPAERDALQAHYLESLTPLQKAMSDFRPSVLVGSSGTFDTLSEIYCQRNQLPFRSEQPETPLAIEAFREIHSELVSKDRSDRMKIPGMIEMRVDMIVVASCLIQYLFEQYRFQKIRVSSFALKEGVLAKMMIAPSE